jgi:hypothetical protein
MCSTAARSDGFASEGSRPASFRATSDSAVQGASARARPDAHITSNDTSHAARMIDCEILAQRAAMGQ